MLKNLIKKNRSYRRFYEKEKIKEETILELIDHARLSPSAANRQPLKYIISCSKKSNNSIFSNLSWAGYIKDWPGPKKGERPAAYIVILGDKNIAKKYWADPGIAIQSILLAAVEKGLGGCTFAAIDKENLRIDLNIDNQYKILYILALGKPKENVKIEKLEHDNIKYWRDEKQVHHVPKRNLKDLIIEI